MKIDYVIADTHFGHDNIIKYENRPFVNSEEMDSEIIRNWNSIVSSEDNIFHFGDFFLCATAKMKRIMKQLNGNIYLIRGNHDRQSNTKLIERLGFVDVFDSYRYKDYIFTHRPIEKPQIFNIHGHTHSQRKDDSKHICVSVEKLNYKPISFEKLEGKIKKLK
jgi:calcineurin-like phosphoesterase family protein